MPFDVRSLIYLSWVLFFVIWILWGLTAKRAIRQQSVASRFAQSAVTMLAFWMLLSPSIRLGPLALRILPLSIVTESIAIMFTVLGFSLCIWARLHLGGNWSATVTVKQDHRLITTGPYAFVRHPIYSGVSLAGLGVAVLNGDLRSGAGLVLMVLGWRMKFQLEEQFMTEQFGTQYLEYMKHVKALVPFVW